MIQVLLNTNIQLIPTSQHLLQTKGVWDQQVMIESQMCLTGVDVDQQTIKKEMDLLGD